METLKRQRSDQFGLTEDILKELDDYESECSVNEFMYTDDVVDDIEHAFLAVSSDGEEDQDDQTSDDEDQDEEVIMKKVINRKTKRQMVALKKQELAAEELITFHNLQEKISVTYDDLVKLKHEELLEIFRMIDDSSNGIIDFGKLLDLGKGVDASFTADKCASLLGRIDNDHNDAVTQSEFLEFFGKMMAPHTRASNDKGMVQIRRAECG